MFTDYFKLFYVNEGGVGFQVINSQESFCLTLDSLAGLLDCPQELIKSLWELQPVDNNGELWLIDLTLKEANAFMKCIEECIKLKNSQPAEQNLQLLLEEDDCAPDSLVYFEKYLKEKYNLTISDFINKGTRTGTSYRLENMVLKMEPDSPFWKLYEISNL